MKKFKLKKLVAIALAVMTIATVSPIGASAAWKQNSTGWWNTEGNSWSTGWRTVDNTWYYFGSDGYMKTGWANDNGTWYYLNPVSDGTKGAMKTGWVNDNGTWYYLNSVSDGTKGAMKTGWVNDNGTWYYLNSVSDGTKGAMKTGWVNDNGTWYFTNSSGAMQTGVVEVNGKVYYLAASGAMATGTVTIDGVTYTFAASGEAIGDKIPTPTVAFTSAGTSETPTKPATDKTDDKDTTSNGGGSSHHHSGGSSSSDTYENITPLVSKIYSDKLASRFNSSTLADNISVTTENGITVKLLDEKLESLQSVFDAATAKDQDLSLIEARLAKAETIMNSHYEMVNVNGEKFEDYLKTAVNNYKVSGGNSNYFKADGSFDNSAIAERIKNNTLKYGEFKEALKDRIIAMCDETKNAPKITISYDGISEKVTKIQKDKTIIYDTSLSIDKNIEGLLSLGDTTATTGTYTIYCEDGYFTVNVTK